MNYEQFLEQMKEDLTERFAKDLPPEFADVRIGIRDVEKLQGKSYRGLSFRSGDSPVEIDLNMIDAFKACEAGHPYEEIAKEVQAQIMGEKDHAPKLDVGELCNYEAIKPKLMLEVIPQEGNEDRLENIPHQKIEDLALVYRLDMWDRAGNKMTSVITNRQLGTFGISAEQLHQDALMNTPISHPAFLRPIYEVLAAMMGKDPEEISPDEPMMLVATTQDAFMGASVIQYPGFLEQAAERIGKDFFILPSSIHEVLLVPDDGILDFHELAEMVQSINEAQVAPAERLSDNVYHYDKMDRVFELADKTASRKLAQEMKKKHRRGIQKRRKFLYWSSSEKRRKRRWIMHRKQKRRAGLSRKQPYDFKGAHRNKGAVEAYYRKWIPFPFFVRRRGRTR